MVKEIGKDDLANIFNSDNFKWKGQNMQYSHVLMLMAAQHCGIFEWKITPSFSVQNIYSF